jgi:hypothetical protein
MLLAIVSIIVFSSCIKIRDGSSGIGWITVSEDKKADARMEQIISALKDKDKEALKSLFSKKALNEANGFDSGMDSLLDFIQGNIESWERDSWASDESVESGKKSLMIRSGYKVITDKEEYFFFVVDYYIDTIDPDNEGIYMLQVTTSGYNEDLGSWQERLRAGFFIPEQ